MKITQLDHLVLTVKDVGATCAFYHRVLGLEIVTFGNGRKALSIGAQKINLHEAGNEIEPHAQNAIPGSGDLCLITATPLTEVIAHLQQNEVPILLGPVERTGARGAILSVYFRDLDTNLIEVSNYQE